MRYVLSLILAALAVPATTPAGAQTLIVGNKGEDSVSFIDLKTGRQRARVPTAAMPHEVAVSPDGARAAVVAYGGKTIDIFDVRRAARIERIDLGTNSRPHGLVWLGDGRLIATTEGSDTLTVVLADARGAPDRVYAIPTGQTGSHMIAVDRGGGTAYVANMGSGTVGVIDLDGRDATRNLRVGTEPEGLALSADGRRLWVADRKGDAVHVIDTATMRTLARLPTGAVPIRVAISPDGRTAVTSNYASGTLSLFDTATMRPTRTVRVSGEATAKQVTILFSSDGRRLYVAETGVDRVAEVDVASGRVLRRMAVGRMGDGLGISSAAGATRR